MATKTVAPGICRFDLDEKKVHGFMVRIMRRGKMHQQFFSDKNWGGKRKARAAADARLEELKQELPDVKTTKNRLTKRNSSGKVGVHYAIETDKRWPDCQYSYYIASWLNEDGKRTNVKFSCNKYGDELAMELAGIARDREMTDREAVEAIYNRRKAARKARKMAARKESPRSRK